MMSEEPLNLCLRREPCREKNEDNCDAHLKIFSYSSFIQPFKRKRLPEPNEYSDTVNVNKYKPQWDPIAENQSMHPHHITNKNIKVDNLNPPLKMISDEGFTKREELPKPKANHYTTNIRKAKFLSYPLAEHQSHHTIDKTVKENSLHLPSKMISDQGFTNTEELPKSKTNHYSVNIRKAKLLSYPMAENQYFPSHHLTDKIVQEDRMYSPLKMISDQCFTTREELPKPTTNCDTANVKKAEPRSEPVTENQSLPSYHTPYQNVKENSLYSPLKVISDQCFTTKEELSKSTINCDTANVKKAELRKEPIAEHQSLHSHHATYQNVKENSLYSPLKIISNQGFATREELPMPTANCDTAIAKIAEPRLEPVAEHQSLHSHHTTYLGVKENSFYSPLKIISNRGYATREELPMPTANCDTAIAKIAETHLEPVAERQSLHSHHATYKNVKENSLYSGLKIIISNQGFTEKEELPKPTANCGPGNVKKAELRKEPIAEHQFLHSHHTTYEDVKENSFYSPLKIISNQSFTAREELPKPTANCDTTIVKKAEPRKETFAEHQSLQTHHTTYKNVKENSFYSPLKIISNQGFAAGEELPKPTANIDTANAKKSETLLEPVAEHQSLHSQNTTYKNVRENSLYSGLKIIISNQGFTERDELPKPTANVDTAYVKKAELHKEPIAEHQSLHSHHSIYEDVKENSFYSPLKIIPNQGFTEREELPKLTAYGDTANAKKAETRIEPIAERQSLNSHHATHKNVKENSLYSGLKIIISSQGFTEREELPKPTANGDTANYKKAETLKEPIAEHQSLHSNHTTYDDVKENSFYSPLKIISNQGFTAREELPKQTVNGDTANVKKAETRIEAIAEHQSIHSQYTTYKNVRENSLYSGLKLIISNQGFTEREELPRPTENCGNGNVMKAELRKEPIAQYQSLHSHHTTYEDVKENSFYSPLKIISNQGYAAREELPKATANCDTAIVKKAEPRKETFAEHQSLQSHYTVYKNVKENSLYSPLKIISNQGFTAREELPKPTANGDTANVKKAELHKEPIAEHQSLHSHYTTYKNVKENSFYSPVKIIPDQSSTAKEELPKPTVNCDTANVKKAEPRKESVAEHLSLHSLNTTYKNVKGNSSYSRINMISDQCFTKREEFAKPTANSDTANVKKAKLLSYYTAKNKSLHSNHTTVIKKKKNNLNLALKKIYGLSFTKRDVLAKLKANSDTAAIKKAKLQRDHIAEHQSLHSHHTTNQKVNKNNVHSPVKIVNDEGFTKSDVLPKPKAVSDVANIKNSKPQRIPTAEHQSLHSNHTTHQKVKKNFNSPLQMVFGKNFTKRDMLPKPNANSDTANTTKGKTQRDPIAGHQSLHSHHTTDRNVKKAFSKMEELQKPEGKNSDTAKVKKSKLQRGPIAEHKSLYSRHSTSKKVKKNNLISPLNISSDQCFTGANKMKEMTTTKSDDKEMSGLQTLISNLETSGKFGKDNSNAHLKKFSKAIERKKLSNFIRKGDKDNASDKNKSKSVAKEGHQTLNVGKRTDEKEKKVNSSAHSKLFSDQSFSTALDRQKMPNPTIKCNILSAEYKAVSGRRKDTSTSNSKVVPDQCFSKIGKGNGFPNSTRNYNKDKAELTKHQTDRKVRKDSSKSYSKISGQYLTAIKKREVANSKINGDKVNETIVQEQTMSSQLKTGGEGETDKGTSKRGKPLGSRYNCKQCDKSFSQYHDLKRHFPIHVDEKPYKCELCERLFSGRENLQTHLLAHKNKTSYSCEKCKKTFSDISDLRNHRVHPREKLNCESNSSIAPKAPKESIKILTNEPYNCEQCKMSFVRLIDLRTHNRTHPREKLKYESKSSPEPNAPKESIKILINEPYNCEQCKMSFVRLVDLKTHSRTHPREKLKSDSKSSPEPDAPKESIKILAKVPYNCQRCKMSFACLADLNAHNRAHPDIDACTCHICGRVVFSKDYLKTHILTHSNEKPYSCDKCEKKFSMRKYLTIHRRVHRTEKPHICAECGRPFANRTYLKKHIRTHTGEKPYVCGQCGRAFTDSQNLLVHRRTHTGEKPYRCDICKKTFSNSNHSKTHRETHNLEKTYKCEKCGKLFISQKNLRDHLRTHALQRPFTCDKCGKTFCYRYYLKVHVLTHTRGKPFVCDQCKRPFALRSGLKVHLRSHTGEKPFKCTECEKCYTTRETLKMHLRSHSGEKPYTCEICKKTFSRRNGWSAHVKTHKNENLYSCAHCEKTFRSRNYLNIHIRSHTGEKPYKCNQCEKSFTYQVGLKMHIRSHTGERPYTCKVCSKSFSRVVGYKNHIITHSGERPYNCEICQKSFALRFTLRRHLSTHSKEETFGCERCKKSYIESSVVKTNIPRDPDEKPYLCEECGESFGILPSLWDHLQKTHSKTGRFKLYLRNCNCMTINEEGVVTTNKEPTQSVIQKYVLKVIPSNSKSLRHHSEMLLDNANTGFTATPPVIQEEVVTTTGCAGTGNDPSKSMTK